MKILILVLLVCLGCSSKWAVLVAGSHTYSNYRHQADIFHAYQLLLSNGFDAAKIITLAYDDIAHDIKNPFKGKVFNKPTFKEPGVDVYAGVKIDYSKNEVTPEIFLDVLLGNKTAVKGKGTQRVLQSTAEDNVFIFFSDHGAAGLIAFPSKYLYADQLVQTLGKMSGKYKKLVFYLEACESGSMFVKLPSNTGIYAVSASNPTESSWATYCAPNDVVQGKHIGSCLGDLFSVSFIEQTEKGNYYSESLEDQFLLMQKLTNASHVLNWGDKSYISTDKVGDFIAGPKKFLMRMTQNDNRLTFAKESLMNSRTNKLQSLAAIYQRTQSPLLLAQMTQEMTSMYLLDETFSKLTKQLTLTGEFDVQNIKFDCLRRTMDGYERKCAKLSDYGLQYVKYFAEACQEHQAIQIIEAIIC